MVRQFLLAHWPTLTPTQFLNDLFGSKALLKVAAPRAGIEVDEALALFVARTSEADLEDRRWSTADVPLLDESFSLLIGSVGEDSEDVRVAERDAASEFDRARRQDDGVDLAEFVHDEELDGFAVVDQSQLGLSSSDYEEAEQDRTRHLAPQVQPHPKFQQRLDQQSEVDHG